MVGLPSTAGRLAGGWIASNTSLKSESPPRIRSRVNRWKFAFSSVVPYTSSAADEVPGAKVMVLILEGTKEKVTEKAMSN